MSTRRLIVNADDFGLSLGTNQGIIETCERGIVTSASLMVRWPAAVEAARYAVAHPKFSVGLHVDLAEWVYTNDQWSSKYQVVPLDDEASVREELQRQIDSFRLLMGRDPTHLDSHQHLHRDEPLLSAMREAADKLSVPLRSFTAGIQYCGGFYGQTGEGHPYPEGISVEGLLQVVAKLPSGITELGCHPGDDAQLDSVYRLERKLEVRALCDPRVRGSLSALDIELCSFSDAVKARTRGGSI